MPRSDPLCSWILEMEESFRQVPLQLQLQPQYEEKERFHLLQLQSEYEEKERFRRLQYKELRKFIIDKAEERFRQRQYEALRKEVENRYRGDPALTALAAKSARMLRALESSIQKPHSSQEEKPWPTVSGLGFGETSQPYWLNNIGQVRGFGTSGDPNLAGSSSGNGWPYQVLHHIPCGASNSSAFGQDTALPLYHNQPNPSNGDAIMEIWEEGNNLSGNPWMPKLGSGETNFAVASSSGINNLAGSSSGFHFQQREMSGGEAVRIGISDEYDDHIPCGASNSSAFGQDTALHLYHNQPNPSNGDAIMEIREEGNNLGGGNPWMPNLGSGETNFAVASSSGINKLGGDDSESSTVAQDVPPGSFLNQPEASNEEADTVSEMHNHNNKKDAAQDAAHETKFRPEVNTMLAAIAGQASVNLITSGSTHDSMYLRLFAAASGIGFLGSFFSMHLLKKPKLAKVLSKIGATGTASSIILSLGIIILQDTNWYLKVVGHGAIVAGCLISGVAVVMAD